MMEYRPELFEIIDMPERHLDTCLYFDGAMVPVKFALHPDARVLVLCDGDIVTVRAGGAVFTHIEGNIGLTTHTGVRVESLNGPLVLAAADRIGKDVEFLHLPDCHHHW